MPHDGCCCCSPQRICRYALAVALVFPVHSLWAQQAASAEAPAAAPAPFISGVAPDRRPEGAPQITQDREVSAPEMEKRLHGVSQPYPGNVEEIARTGEWFVPLRHRGMTPPYDIRDWHAESTK